MDGKAVPIKTPLASLSPSSVTQLETTAMRVLLLGLLAWFLEHLLASGSGGDTAVLMLRLCGRPPLGGPQDLPTSSLADYALQTRHCAD